MRDVVRRELPRLRSRRLANADDGRRRHGAIDVLARHAPVAASSFNPRRIDSVLQARSTD